MNAELAGQLLATTTVKDLVELISTIQENGVRVAWKPVGDTDNNLATINLGSDPAAGIIERVTNALDAVLEREWIEKGQPTNLHSPRSAVETWFKVQGGHLDTLKRNEIRRLDELASRVQITLRDSDRNDKPTVDIRDYGIGLKPEEFGVSILSLKGNRKLRKLFLAGAFGQGGSTALAYSPFTVICSRKATTNGEKGVFSFTVVRFNPGDPNVDKHGVYEYMVDHSNGQPVIADIPEKEFAAGTLVRHVTMDVAKYSAVLTAPTGSLWFLTHNYLFDPVLPFKIEDARKNKNAATRTVTGNHRLLSQGEYTEYQNSALLTFSNGSVTISWWVLSAEGENARSRITQYVMVSKPVVVTFNGQKQGDFPNTVIKDELKLPYLDRYIVVHVDCDKLDAEARRQLFPTTREALRDTPIGDDLRRLVVDTLAGDPELRRLDHERKQRYIKHEDQSTVDVIRKRLASRVSVFTKGSGGGAGSRVTPPEPSPTPSPRQPIPVQDPPTFVKITSASPRHVYAGRSFTLRFETDARPDYFMHPDNFIAVVVPPSFGRYTGTTTVREGHGIAYFKAAEDLAVGTKGTITLEVRPPRSQSLSASVDVETVEPPQTAGSATGDARTPNINPHWVTEGDAFWKEHGWNRKSVASVIREEDSIEIYVSADNERLGQLIARGQRRDVTAVDSIKEFYFEHIAFFALLDDLGRTSEEKTSISDEIVEQATGRALNHACETVCGIIDDLFEILVTSPRS